MAAPTVMIPLTNLVPSTVMINAVKSMQFAIRVIATSVPAASVLILLALEEKYK